MTTDYSFHIGCFSHFRLLQPSTIEGGVGLINNRNLLLTVLEVGSLRSQCQQGQVLARAPFQAAEC